MKNSRIGKRILAVLLSVILLASGNISMLSASADEALVAADVVFVVDSTGSMSDEIYSVRNGIADFVGQLIDARVDLRVGVLEYRDITCDGMASTVIHEVNGSPWHYTVDEIRGTMGNIYADGGGDGPETLVDALGFLSKGEMKFRSGAHKFAFVLTDASYKYNNRHGYGSMSEVISILQDMQVSVSVITDPYYYDFSWEQGDSTDSDSYYDATVGGLSGSIGDEPHLSSANPGYVSPRSSDNGGRSASLSQGRSAKSDLAPVGSFGDEINAAEIVPGTYTATIGTDSSYAYFAFTPSETGKYSFYSISTDDTYCDLYGSDGGYLYYNDDGGENRNFLMRVILSAGVTYYFGVRYYSIDNTGEFDVLLTYDGSVSSVGMNYTYREIVEETNGILADIYGDFATILFDFAQQILEITYKAKKAIYILPGYMGSELYTSDTGEKVWVDKDYLISDVLERFINPFGEDSILMMNSDGTGSKVRADLTKDDYGSVDTYQNLVTALRNSCGDEYDVIFFPYNWLGDLSDSAAALERHIKLNKYDKVVLVTHSTGGLLAANFIARSVTNKKMVEKAILIAPPLLGTLTSLQPIETGQTKDLDDMLANNGVDAGFLGLKYKVIHQWVKAVTKNSPTTYQLLPSAEYLSTVAAIYEMEGAVTSKDEYYEMLNGSGNINPNLTNGNSRSHDYFRTNILGGDIVKVLKSVDTLIVCSESGNTTPAICVYARKLFGKTELTDIIYKDDGDGTVMGFSATAQRTAGKYELPYRSFPGVSHGDLASSESILAYICGQINGDDASLSSGYGVAATGAGDESRPISDYVKFRFSSDNEITLSVYDSDGDAVDINNAADEDAIYTVLSVEEGDYRSILYVPNSGWKVEVSAAETDADAITGTVSVSTLDADGFNAKMATYPMALSAESAMIFDMSAITVTEANIGDLIPEHNNVEVKEYDTNWDITPPAVLESIGDTAAVELVGAAVTGGAVKAENLVWTSSAPEVVTVSETGTISAVSYGKATVTAMQPGSLKTVSCEITVRKKPTTIALPNIEMEPEEKVVLTPLFDADDVTETDVVYTTSSTDVSIDGDTITALKVGSATVTATAVGGATTTFNVTVVDNSNIPVESISTDVVGAGIEYGKTATFTAEVTPDTATNKNVSWVVETEGVVEIESYNNTTCTVRGVGLGTTNVYAVTADGGFSAAISVKVYSPILGDADGDGAVTVMDATVIQRHLAKYFNLYPEIILKCGDLSGDGIDIMDATNIQRYRGSYEVPYAIGEPIE